MPGDETAEEVLNRVQVVVAVDRFLKLYEQRTQVLERIATSLETGGVVERIAMAMEHANEKTWHTVR